MKQGSFKKALGVVIYELRRERKLSQERLAFEANVDRTRAGEIERGEANPTVDTLARIADVLGYSLGTLIIRAELAAYIDDTCQDEFNAAWFITNFHGRGPMKHSDPNLQVSQLAKVLSSDHWDNSKGGS